MYKGSLGFASYLLKVDRRIRKNRSTDLVVTFSIFSSLTWSSQLNYCCTIARYIFSKLRLATF